MMRLQSTQSNIKGKKEIYMLFMGKKCSLNEKKN